MRGIRRTAGPPDFHIYGYTDQGLDAPAAARQSDPPAAFAMASRFGTPIAILTAAVSAASLWWTPLYAHETRSWAAQGIGQDAVNLFVVVPLLIATLAGVHRQSWRAWLVWLGVTIYLAYSYVLYAFFVHFGPAFPAYVALLGLACYALFTTTIVTPRHVIVRELATMARDVPAETLLFVQAALFAAAWLADISGALAHGTAPHGALELGFAVNPIHVLDLAFVLPAMMTTALLLQRDSPYGRLFVVPLLVFSALMGAAIVGMTFAMTARGIAASGLVAGVIGLFALADIWCAIRLVRPLGGLLGEGSASRPTKTRP